MKTIGITRILLVAGLSVGLGCSMATAQDAGQDIKDAGHATKTTTKRVYHKTKHVTRKTYHKTAEGTKTATHRTENAGDALAGKPEGH